MKAFMHRLVFWTRNGLNYWIFIGPLVVAIISFITLNEYSWGLNVFRIIGIVIEILGLFTVVISLSKESKKYNHPGYIKSLMLWVYDFKNVIHAKNVTAICGNASVSISISGNAITSTGCTSNTVEGKIEYLMQKVVSLENLIDLNNSQIKQVESELMAEIRNIEAVIKNEVIRINDDLKDKATIDYCMLVSGAWLTLLGMIITNLPDAYFKYVFNK